MSKTTNGTTQPIRNSMNIEIWSDVMCPFCYLGKRKFELALEQFPKRDHVQVVWKSFLLQPDLKTDPAVNVHDYLSESKGFPVEKARHLNGQITEAGERVGLEYNFDRVIVANTMNAHRLLHIAKEQEVQDAMKERLLKAYFTDGMNVDDTGTLVELGVEAGVSGEGLSELLESDTYIREVREDIADSRKLGVRGVPFFLFNRRYAVSGAQDPAVFLQTLEKSFSEWREQHPEILLEVAEGESCTPEEGCE